MGPSIASVTFLVAAMGMVPFAIGRRRQVPVATAAAMPRATDPQCGPVFSDRTAPDQTAEYDTTLVEYVRRDCRRHEHGERRAPSRNSR